MQQSNETLFFLTKIIKLFMKNEVHLVSNLSKLTSFPVPSFLGFDYRLINSRIIATFSVKFCFHDSSPNLSVDANKSHKVKRVLKS